jgi:AAA15 family ATPase/GTPase
LFLNTITVIFAGVTTKKAMLLRVIVQNFLSFFEPVQFDMFPNMKKETFESHIYRNQQIPVLKQAALFGPNGSGKSNFVKP